MKRHVSSPAQYRLEDRVLFVLLPMSLLFLILSILGFGHTHLTGALAVAAAALATVPVVAVVVLFGLYLGEETDEFQKSLRVRALLWSTGITLTATTFCGSLETMVHVQKISIYSVQFLFFIAYVLAVRILRWRYR
jgi:hypothetical protein